MPLGTEVGLGPGHTVLDGDPATPPPKGRSPLQFSVHIYCGQVAAWMKMPLGREVRLGPSDILRVRWGPSSPSQKGGTASPIIGPCLLCPNG